MGGGGGTSTVQATPQLQQLQTQSPTNYAEVMRSSELGITPGQQFNYSQLSNPLYQGFTPRVLSGDTLNSYQAPALASSGKYKTYSAGGKTFDVWLPGKGADYKNFKNYYPFKQGAWNAQQLPTPPQAVAPTPEYYTRSGVPGAGIETPYTGEISRLNPKGSTPVYDRRGNIIGYQ